MVLVLLCSKRVKSLRLILRPISRKDETVEGMR